MTNKDQFTGSATVGTTPVVIVNRDLKGDYSILEVEIDNAAGGQALNAFSAEFQSHPNGEWYEALADADFDTTNETLLRVSDNGPEDLAAGSVAHFKLNVQGLHAVRFKGGTASGEATVTARCTAAGGV